MPTTRRTRSAITNRTILVTTISFSPLIILLELILEGFSNGVVVKVLAFGRDQQHATVRMRMC